MDNSDDQGQGGGLFDAVKQKGQDYLSDPQHQEQLKNQAQERFGNVPGMDRVSGAMGQTGGGTEPSGDQGSDMSGDQETGGGEYAGGEEQDSGAGGDQSEY